jgi:hypothetical protein
VFQKIEKIFRESGAPTRSLLPSSKGLPSFAKDPPWEAQIEADKSTKFETATTGRRGALPAEAFWQLRLLSALAALGVTLFSRS